MVSTPDKTSASPANIDSDSPAGMAGDSWHPGSWRGESVIGAGGGCRGVIIYHAAPPSRPNPHTQHLPPNPHAPTLALATARLCVFPWPDYRCEQLPEYPDKSAVEEVEAELRKCAPLTFAGEMRELQAQLAEVRRWCGMWYVVCGLWFVVCGKVWGRIWLGGLGRKRARARRSRGAPHPACRVCRAARSTLT